MNVLVTGGAGFIGSHTVERLLEEGHEVYVVDCSDKNIDRNLKESNARIVHCDINNINTIGFDAPIDWVVHMAALADIVPSIKNPVDYHKTNVSGTVEALELAKRVNAKKFIYIASGSCYGDSPPIPTDESAPINCKYPYALTKYLGEQYALHFGRVYKIPTISLRLFNVYGPRSRTTGAYGAVFGVFLKQKLENKPFTVVGDGYQSRDFVYVTDVVDAIMAALKTHNYDEVYNIGSGYHTNIRQLCNLLGSNSIDYIPDRPGEPRITLSRIAKAQDHLKWNPKTPLAVGTKIMVENIEYWKDAPLWDKASIGEATEEWFKHMGDKNAN